MPDLAVWFSDYLPFLGIENFDYEIDQALGIGDREIRSNRMVTGGDGEGGHEFQVYWSYGDGKGLKNRRNGETERREALVRILA
jgi:hypothetical protein